MKLTKEVLKKMIREEFERTQGEEDMEDEDLSGGSKIDGGKAIKALDKLGNVILELEYLFGEKDTLGIKAATKKFIQRINDNHQLEYNLDWFGEE